MLYLKNFLTEEERQACTDTQDYVSYTEETDKVRINHFVPLEETPLTLVALTDGTISYTNGYQTFGITYSTDNGRTWSEPSGDITVNVTAGDKVQWMGQISTTIGNPGKFSEGTASFNIEGNIMSIFYGENFIGQTEFTRYKYTMNLFANSKCVDASKLIMNLTSLGNGCYGMFSGCTELTIAPTLTAQVLTYSCYCNMFNGCTNLSYIEMLATDISASDCLTGWVDGVAANGTFVKAASMTTLPIGANGIPEGWTVQDATE